MRTEKSTNSIAEDLLIDLTYFEDSRGGLMALEGNLLPFAINRIFFTSVTNQNEIRGGHSHKICYQFLIPINGDIEVTVKSNLGDFVVLLRKEDSVGLLLPPNFWGQQKFLEKDAVLAVLASHAYDPGDYVYEMP